MSLIVQKFGGTSVADPGRIKQVAKIIAYAAKQGNEVIAVVSAMGKTTDNLIALADRITDQAPGREMDMLLSTGEQVSIALLAMAVESLGVKARSFTGCQAGIITDGAHQNASIKEIRTNGIKEALARHQVAIVAGFQGVTEAGEICTLGRGGSDTTAVSLAAAFATGDCHIFSDVDGVYTADPHLFPRARKLSALSFDEMLEMSLSGARVMNSRSIEMAMHHNVAIRLRSAFAPDDSGTLIGPRSLTPEYVVCGIACDTSKVAFHLQLPQRGHTQKATAAYLEGISHLFSCLKQEGIATDMVTLLDGRRGSGPQLLFMAEKRLAAKAQKAIERLSHLLHYPQMEIDRHIARISVVGNGLGCRRGVVAAIFDTLLSASIPVRMLTTGDIRVTALIPAEYTNRAVERIHQRFCEYLEASPDGTMIAQLRSSVSNG